MTFGRRNIEAHALRRAAQKAAHLSVLSIPRNQAGATYSGGTSGIAVVKGPAAKPGKRTPTVDESAWMDAITAFGCVACWSEGRPGVPAAVHHILRGGVRMGHLFTLPLCPGHHQHGTGAPGLVARHPFKTRFETRYGAEFALLATLQGVLKQRPDGSYAP